MFSYSYPDHTRIVLKLLCKVYNVFYCVNVFRWLGNQASGMSIIEVRLLTGYVIENAEAIENQHPAIKRVEADQKTVVVYLDEVTNFSFFCKFTLTLLTNLCSDNLISFLKLEQTKRPTLAFLFWLLLAINKQ